MRRRLPKGVRMYSGDDFNYPELIAGDEEGYSDALLGIFDAIAPAASAAFGAMARQDMAGYHEILAPTVDELSWSVPADIVFVKGDLAGVSGYPIDSTGSIPAALSIDTSADAPAPGSGLYYLVKLGGDCSAGSWQTSLDSEPGRDVALP